MTAWGGSHENEIIVDWDGEETFLLYTMNHYAAHYNADIYTEIRQENDALMEKVVLMELDCRYGYAKDINTHLEHLINSNGQPVERLQE